MSCLGFSASLCLVGAVALSVHSHVSASELQNPGGFSHQSLLRQGENLQDILAESEQLLNQSVRIGLGEAIHKTIINNPQISRAIALVKARKSQVSAEKRKWNPTLKFSRTSEDPILGQKISTLVQTNDNYRNVENANFTNSALPLLRLV